MTIVSVLFVFGLLGCAKTGAANTTNSPAIDSRFAEFYDLMGGKRALGEALGPAFQQDPKTMQYTQNVLLVYDESQPVGDRFNFELLGRTFQIDDPPLPVPENQSDVRYLNGHIISAAFVPFFDLLGGVRFVGYPLTEVRWNAEQSRYEQYFEKMGFYQREGENQIHLLPYGLIACQRQQTETGCATVIADASIASGAYLPQPFLPIVQRLGQGFTGTPLSEPYSASDGRLEQVYENVVLVVEPDNLRTISLRSLPTLTGHQPGPLVSPLNDPLMVFLALDVDNNLGHNIPKPFLEYIATHGGIELSGQPISELFEENGIRRQCFTNYCLDFDPSAPTGTQIRPTPLGHHYLRQQNYQPAPINILVWEKHSRTTPNQEQVLAARVYNDISNLPMQDIEPVVEITLPNGQIKKMVFPPTSNSGNTYLPVRLPDLKSGDLIPYKVCVSQPGSAPLCVSDSWLVH